MLGLLRSGRQQNETQNTAGRRQRRGARLGGVAGSGAGKDNGRCTVLLRLPASGTADLLCRILADAAKPEIGQNVIVESKSGASGFIANETVANAAPDGRTVGLAAMAAMCVSPVMPGQKLPINVDTDLTPTPASPASTTSWCSASTCRSEPSRS